MTGPVTYEQIWQLFVIFFAAGGVVAAAVGWVWRLVVLLRKLFIGFRDELVTRIEAAETKTVLAMERAKLAEETSRQELNDFQVHAAEHFASKSGVTTQIERLEQAVNGIAEKVDSQGDRITARIDRLLESQNGGAPPRRRSSG